MLRHATPAGDRSCWLVRGRVTVNVAPPSGLFRASMVPPCASTIVRTIVSPIPRPCGFVVTNGVNSVPSTFGGRPVPESRTESRTSAASTCRRDRETPPGRRGPGHGVDRVHHQVHQHLLQEHGIAVDDARARRQVDDGFDLPRLQVVSDERQAFADDGVEVDRLPVKLTTSQHRPMPLDDLRGLDALRPDVGQDLLRRVGRRTIGVDHRSKRLGVVDHRAEGLTELVGNRRGQRRHRLTAAGVGGERQVPPAVALGLPPCAALGQEADDEQRLEGQRADRSKHGELVLLPQAWDCDGARRCPPAAGSPRSPTAATRARRTSVGKTVVRRHCDASRRRAVQDAGSHVGGAATEVAYGHQPSADDPMAKHRAHRSE